MRTFPALATLAVVCTGLLAGCGGSSDPASQAESDPEVTEDPTATSDPNDEFQPLQVSMVAQSGTYFPDGVDGVTIGCSDTLVTIGTVPTATDDREDHVTQAIEFLLNDSQYYHGSPAVTNSLTLSETLELSSVEVTRSGVDITLSGDVEVRGECEAYRIQAQLYATAANTAETNDVSITLDGTELDQVLGVEPVEVSQLVDISE